MSNKCPHGDELWINPSNHSSTSSIYQEGYFKHFFCYQQESLCPFDNEQECIIYQKKEKE